MLEEINNNNKIKVALVPALEVLVAVFLIYLEVVLHLLNNKLVTSKEEVFKGKNNNNLNSQLVVVNNHPNHKMWEEVMY